MSFALRHTQKLIPKKSFQNYHRRHLSDSLNSKDECFRRLIINMQKEARELNYNINNSEEVLIETKVRKAINVLKQIDKESPNTFVLEPSVSFKYEEFTVTLKTKK